MSAMNKENLINQLPSSPYTPTQKVRSRKNSQITPKLLPPLTGSFHASGAQGLHPSEEQRYQVQGAPFFTLHASYGCLAYQICN